MTRSKTPSTSMEFHGMTCFEKPKVFLLSKETANLRDENTKAKKNMCMCMHPYRNPNHLAPLTTTSLSFVQFEVWRRNNKSTPCVFPLPPRGVFLHSGNLIKSDSHPRLPMDSSRQSQQKHTIWYQPTSKSKRGYSINLQPWKPLRGANLVRESTSWLAPPPPIGLCLRASHDLLSQKIPANPWASWCNRVEAAMAARMQTSFLAQHFSKNRKAAEFLNT